MLFSMLDETCMQLFSVKYFSVEESHCQSPLAVADAAGCKCGDFLVLAQH
jgi:hypothetical protein